MRGLLDWFFDWRVRWRRNVGALCDAAEIEIESREFEARRAGAIGALGNFCGHGKEFWGGIAPGR